MRRFWKLWYRAKKWWRYRSYYRNLPERDPVEYVGRMRNPLGEEIGVVENGITSRPIPTPTHPSSKYGKRICQSKEPKGRGLIDEDLQINP